MCVYSVDINIYVYTIPTSEAGGRGADLGGGRRLSLVPVSRPTSASVIFIIMFIIIIIISSSRSSSSSSSIIIISITITITIKYS